VANDVPEGEQNEIHKVHMLQSLQALQYLKTVQIPHISWLEDKMVYLPTVDRTKYKKTLVFDMDETLIHCVDDIEAENPQFIIKVPIDGEDVEAGINVRPYALEWLETVNQKFEVVVFTASHQSYADAVLDFIDPDGDLIQKRLYRDSCYETEDGVYIKDLRIFGNRDLKDVIIVDNAVYSFGFQLNNGIPIIPYYHDPNDEELFHLIPFLEILAYAPDIRVKNKEAFQLEDMADEELGEFNRICDVSQNVYTQEDDYDEYD
jgi:CTD small phosphatase-like protein 2